jgi:hypothetical protein
MQSDILIEMTRANAGLLHSVCVNAAEMVILAETLLRGDTARLAVLRESFEATAEGLRVRIDSSIATEDPRNPMLRIRVDKLFAQQLTAAIREFEETRLNGVITQILVGMLR